MSFNLSGVGEPMLLTRDLLSSTIAQELMFSPDLVDFDLSTDVADPRQIKAWKDCKKVLVASAAGEEESTLTLKYKIDWATMQIAAGELAQAVNVTLPTRKTGTIPSATPYEISDAAITSGADIRVYLAEKVGDEQPGHLTASTSAPTGRQFQIETGKLTFPSTLAGAAVVYSEPKALTSVQSIGKAPSPVSLSEYQFVGHACGDDWPQGVTIHIPRIKQSGKPSINTEDDEPVLEIPFSCLVAPGERAPIHYYLMPSS